MPIFGAIKAGGTKFVCAVGDGYAGSLRTVTIPTRDPDATFANVAQFFGAWARLSASAGPASGRSA